MSISPESWKPFVSDWNRNYVPSRGLAYSFVLHELALLACFMFSFVSSPPIVLKTPLEEIHSAEITYLPNTGGGDSGGNEGARGHEGEGKSASAAKREGMTFKGPQYLRSDSPDPDNNLQTILQPALTNPPRLNFPLQVPNIIRVAKSKPKPQDVTPPKPKMKMALKDVPLPTATTKPVLKAQAEPIATPLRSEKVPLLALPEMQPITRSAEPEKIVVTPEERVTPPPVVTADASLAAHPLAVLNAMRITTPSLVIPPGEKRASFEVSPAGTASTHGAESRAGVPGGKPGLGSGNGAGNAKAGMGGGGSGSGTVGNAGGKSGAGTGSGDAGTGSGKGSEGAGSGASGRGGNGSGRGPGSGNGSGSGSGNGSGSGPGDGPFPGIQIIGGAGSGMDGGGGGARVPSPAPKGYDFTIIASGGSGGGLKDFGVFHNQAVYTVYVDVSEIAATSQAWVLQYADTGSGPRTAEVNLGSDGIVQPPPAMLEPPYALNKSLPEKLDTPPTNAMTVITGIISRDGKFENAKVLQAPNELIGKQWAGALATWTFRPATKGGAPISVRALLGIPVF
jgi:hypothetical protein